MRRREFIAFTCVAAVTWPLAAPAQQTSKLPIIGFLGSSRRSTQAPWAAAFAQRLHELGWTDGSNVAIE
jgi:putative tryptophan/tyrosine transport system substrate-binding protein